MAKIGKTTAAQATTPATVEEYRVAIGALVVGKSDRRALGSTVRADELPEGQLAFFLKDGTLKPEAKG